MRIAKVVVKHFRSIKKIELGVSETCILAGPNSCGKSNVLRAIRFAFVDSYSADRVAANFPTFITGPAAEISVRIEFDKPTPSVAGRFALPVGAPFSYEVSVRRSAKAKYSLNGVTISSAERDEFLAEFMVVYVPPIRDIASDGLAPLKGLLGRALRSAKKGQSIAALNAVVRTALTQKGNEVLQKAGNEFGSIDAIGKVAADALGVDVALAVEQLKLKVKLAGKGDVPLAALGTGHQSQVVMNLFGALGASFQGQVNQVEQLRAAPPAAPVLTLYSLYMHVAAFEDYQKNVSWSRPAWWLEHDGVRQPHSTESVVVLPLPVPLRRGETIGYMGEDVPSYAGLLAGQPTSQRLLHLEVFSGDDVPAYFVASRNWAKEYVPDTDRTLLVLHPGDTLQGDSGRAISVNQRQILPVQGLSARTVEGKRWRKVSLPASQGNLEGWIEEAAHAVSPWEWPGFDVHEGLAAEDGFRHDNVEGFAKYIRGEEPRPPDTPFYQTLRAFIDRDRDGHLSEEELDHVLRSRFLADMIGRVVVRHESAWSGSYLKKQMATAECIARLLGPAALECRRNEVPRAERLPWWDDVSSKVEGFPTNTKVYHFHPGGLAGTFIGAGDDKAPWMEIAIRELKRWGGTKETVIDDTVNYHREIGLNFDSLTTATNCTLY